MSDEQNEDGEEQPKKASFDLSQFIPKVEHRDTVYVSSATSTDARSKLRKAIVDDNSLSEEEFAELLVQTAINPRGSDE